MVKFKTKKYLKMAKRFLLCLILVHAFLGLSKAEEITAISNRPAESPLSSRKLGKHETGLSPEATKETEGESVEEMMELKKKNHQSRDRSVVGGGVILGGLATTFFVTIFCYIRATRRQKLHIQSESEPQTPV